MNKHLHKTHCIFCHKTFFLDELRPVLGFATARACEYCQTKFLKQTERNVAQIKREYMRGQLVSNVLLGLSMVVWAVMIVAVFIPVAVVVGVAGKLTSKRKYVAD